MCERNQKLVAVFFIFSVVIGPIGCALFKSATDTSCKVIEVAHEACNIIRYIGEDGKEHEEKVSSEELTAFARGVAAKRAAGGADASTK